MKVTPQQSCSKNGHVQMHDSWRVQLVSRSLKASGPAAVQHCPGQQIGCGRWRISLLSLCLCLCEVCMGNEQKLHVIYQRVFAFHRVSKFTDTLLLIMERLYVSRALYGAVIKCLAVWSSKVLNLKQCLSEKRNFCP